jgi:hypothetical protein
LSQSSGGDLLLLLLHLRLRLRTTAVAVSHHHNRLGCRHHIYVATVMLLLFQQVGC